MYVCLACVYRTGGIPSRQPSLRGKGQVPLHAAQFGRHAGAPSRPSSNAHTHADSGTTESQSDEKSDSDTDLSESGSESDTSEWSLDYESEMCEMGSGAGCSAALQNSGAGSQAAAEQEMLWLLAQRTLSKVTPSVSLGTCNIGEQQATGARTTAETSQGIPPPPLPLPPPGGVYVFEGQSVRVPDAWPTEQRMGTEALCPELKAVILSVLHPKTTRVANQGKHTHTVESYNLICCYTSMQPLRST